MVFKESKILNIDRSGAAYLKIFHCYHNFKKRYSKVGNYVKASVKTLERWPVRIRGKRYRPIRVGFILRGFNAMNRNNNEINNSMKIKTTANTCIIIKRRGCLRSGFLLGPLLRPVRTKRFFYIFDVVL